VIVTVLWEDQRERQKQGFGPGALLAQACIPSLREALLREVPGAYELALLDANAETVVEACCDATGHARPAAKPNPDERDRMLMKVVWGPVTARTRVRHDIPSFDRLVRRVAERVRAIR
jgi:hypothetical protein